MEQAEYHGPPLPPKGFNLAAWYSHISFSWMGHTVRKANHQRQTQGWAALEEADANCTLPPQENAAVMSAAFEEAYAKAKVAHGPIPSTAWLNLTTRTIIKLYRTYLSWHCIWAAVEVSVRLLSPLVLRQFLRWLQDYSAGNAPDVWRGWLLAFALGVMGFSMCVIHHRLFWAGMHMGYTMRQQCIAAVHAKALRLNAAAVAHINNGHITNLVSNDVRRFEDAMPFWVFLWAGPLELAMVLLMVSLELGFVPALAGISTTLMLIPIQSLLVRPVAGIRRSTALLTDERVRLTGEVVQGALAMKMLSWELPFSKAVSDIRAQEARHLRRMAHIKSVNMALQFAITPIVSFTTFGVYRALNGELSISSVFYSLSLLHLPKLYMVTFFVMAVQSVTELRVSISRVDKFLGCEEPPLPTHVHTAAAAAAAAAASNQPPAAAAAPQHNVAPKDVAAAAQGDQHVVNAGSEDAASAGVLRTGQVALRGAAYDWARPLGHLPLNNLVLQPAGSDKGDKADAAANGGKRGLGSHTASTASLATDYSRAASESSRRVTLKDVEFELAPGELLGICGEVGAGKSSILAALLGELQPLPDSDSSSGAGEGTGSGAVGVAGEGTGPVMVGSVAYCAQVPWIVAGTVRDNILFGKPLDLPRYQAVLSACALDMDIAQLPAGDATELGERGINLSGGQKARVALARAAYAQASICLLDDPLSAVDPRVARTLFNECIGPGGVMQGTTRVLVTHQRQFLPMCDRVMVLRSGQVRVLAPWSEVEPLQLTELTAGGGPGDGEEVTVDEMADAQAAAAAAAAGAATGAAQVKETAVSTVPQPVAAVPAAVSSTVTGTESQSLPAADGHTHSIESDGDGLASASTSGSANGEKLTGQNGQHVEGQVVAVLLASSDGDDVGEVAHVDGNGLGGEKTAAKSPAKTVQFKQLSVAVNPEEEVGGGGGGVVSPGPTSKPSFYSKPSMLRKALSNAFARGSGPLEASKSFRGSAPGGGWATTPGPWQADLKRRNTWKEDEEEAGGKAVGLPVKGASGRWAHQASFGRMLGRVLSSAPTRPRMTSSKEVAGQLVKDEDRNLGDVPFKVYWKYLMSLGRIVSLLLFIAMFAGQAAYLASEWWLSLWARASPGDQGSVRWLWVYGMLTGLVIVLSLIRSFLFFDSTVTASTRIHDLMTRTVFRAPLAFFHTNPAGRVINRFSKDLGSIDDLLPFTLFDALQVGFLVFSALVLVSIAIPVILPVFLPLVVAFAILRSRYLTTTREVKRQEATARSPVFAAFTATLKGLPTIRAYNSQGRFQTAFLKLLSINGAWYHLYLATQRWVGFRLDVISASTLMAAALLAMASRATVQPQMIALALTHVLQLTGFMQWFIRQTAEVENIMTSMERMLEYTELSQEPPLLEEGGAPGPPGWPASGSVEYQAVTAIYRPGLPPVLSDITFSLKAGSSCGVVGRTGSGKSSLMLTLFRLIPVTEGRILLDGVDISSIGLDALRKQLAIIPQDPVLFSGTIRHNLDPWGKHMDDELWQVLAAAKLQTVISEAGGLDARMAEAGDNLSVGQRQLFCLARALLQKAKVLALDEATANVDRGTDALIQGALREFSHSATDGRVILVIAHRIDTIIDSDYLLVLQSGQLVEQGPPADLSTRPGGLFSSMVSAARQAHAPGSPAS